MGVSTSGFSFCFPPGEFFFHFPFLCDDPDPFFFLAFPPSPTAFVCCFATLFGDSAPMCPPLFLLFLRSTFLQTLFPDRCLLAFTEFFLSRLLVNGTQNACKSLMAESSRCFELW